MGVLLGILDGIIVLAGSIVLKNPENVLIALIVIMVSSKVTDLVINKFDCSKMCYIITQKSQDISKVLLANSPRGITSIDCMGMYQGKQSNLLLTVIKNRQITQMKKIISKTDKDAFVIVSDTSEVLGNGFKQID